MPKFKARPLPDFHEVNLPEKKVNEPTKPAPFKLMVDERGSVKSERWEQMVNFLIFFFLLSPVHEGNSLGAGWLLFILSPPSPS